MQLPQGAPRKPHRYAVRAGDIPRYPPIEFAYCRGYSKWYANAGWATYERHFAHWAERNGYRLDYATQQELHFNPELLADYQCIVMLGHDEYWSREMRLNIENYMQAGGHFARFGGNFCWQIRLEDGGQTQVCYKDSAASADPVRDSEQAHLLTSVWEDPAVGWPGAQTVGLNALQGIYANVGHIAPRQGGAFTVYRPEHWALADTQLNFGDQFGGPARIFGYEVDGLDYQIHQGLPVPTGKDGALPNTEILAMGLAGNLEIDHGNPGTQLYYGAAADIPGISQCRYGDDSQPLQQAACRGNGMIIHAPFGDGELFNAGSSEWVAGLQHRDLDTQQIPHNVLRRYSRRN